MDNEIITIHSTHLACKPIILEPQSGVCFPGVFRDVSRRSVPQWEDVVEDVSAKGLRPWQVRAQASVLAAIIVSTASGMVAVAGRLSCVAVDAPAGVDGAAHIAVVAEMLMHRDGGGLLAAWRCLVNGRVLGGTH